VFFALKMLVKTWTPLGGVAAQTLSKVLMHETLETRGKLQKGRDGQQTISSIPCLK